MNKFEEMAAEAARIRGNVHSLRSDDSAADRPFPPLDAYAEYAPPPPADRASAFFPASELDGLPVKPRQWLVEGLVPSGTVTLLGGDGGTGKSLIALQLAVAVATSGHWIGRASATGPAVYLSAEDDRDEMHRRLYDITRAERIAFPELDRLLIRSMAGEDALLASLIPGTGILAATQLMHEISAYIAEVAPTLVVLDTLADLFAGNENDRGQARQFIGHLRGLAIRNDCAVIILSHPSLSGLNSGTGTSGSTAWSNSCRSRLYLERVMDDGYEPNEDARTLTSKKSNYGPTGREIRVTWRDGVFVPDSLDIDDLGADYRAERVFLKLLEQITAQGRRVNHEGGRTYAPNVFACHPAAEGVSRRAFQRAMESHLAAGRVVVKVDGPPSKRRQFLEVAR